MSEPQLNAEYLDIEGVAVRAGITVKSAKEYLSGGRMPQPDLVFLKQKLWLVSTIEEWRKGVKPAKQRRRRVKVPARHQFRTQESVTAGKPIRVPRLALPEPAEPPAKMPKRRKGVKISREVALKVAATLRAQGHHCTSEDVQDLGTWLGELKPERELLRQQVLSRLRASGVTL